MDSAVGRGIRVFGQRYSSPIDLSGWRDTVLDDSVAVPRAVVPLDGGRLLVAGQEGLVLVIEDGKRRSRPFLDISTRIDGPTAGYLELGMPGFALAPDFATSGRFYTFATLPPRADDPEGSVRVDTLSRWRADPTSLIADPKSREDLLAVPRPMADHVAGEIVFDASGRLYTAFGAESFSATAQDPNDLAGKVIRIDPRQPGDANTPYGGCPTTIRMPRAAATRKSSPPDTATHGGWPDWRSGIAGRVGDVHRQTATAECAPARGQRGLSGGAHGVLGRGCGVPGVPDHRGRSCDHPAGAHYGVQVGTILSGVAPITGGATDNPLRGQVLVADWSGSVLRTAQPGQAPWPFPECVAAQGRPQPQPASVGSHRRPRRQRLCPDHRQVDDLRQGRPPRALSPPGRVISSSTQPSPDRR